MLCFPSEDGQGLVEYALILLFIAIVVIAIVTLFGTTLVEAYSRFVDAVPWS